MITKMELQKFPQFLDVSDSYIEKLVKQVKIHYFNEHEVIIHKGDQVGGAYLVTAGCLRVYTMDANGKEFTLYDINAGESCLLALNCIFSRFLYPAWVSCSSPMTKVAVIPSNLYKELHEHEKNIQNFTVNTLSHRVFNIMSAMEEAMSYNVEQRIASYIIRKASDDMIINSSHQDIASEVGSAREVVSRILKKFEETGEVSLSRGAIRINDLDRVRYHLSI